jgi:cold shock CspA family protein
LAAGNGDAMPKIKKVERLIKGHIVKWFDDRGFGFVKPKRATHDVYLHISKVIEGVPYYGADVEFKMSDTARPIAFEVKVLSQEGFADDGHERRNGILTLHGEMEI